MPLGGPSVPPNPPVVEDVNRPHVRAIPAPQGLDALTRNTLGLKAFNSQTFTGAANQTIQQVGPANRLRIRRIIFQVTANAAVSGAANGVEVTVEILDNGNKTGLVWLVFITQNQVVGGIGGVYQDFDLGDGWVSNQASLIQVTASSTLTSGHFQVIVLGNEEQGE